MNFRDFVEQTKDAIHTLVSGMSGDRAVTPMLHLESEDGITIVAVDGSWFTDDEAKASLISDFVIPLIRQQQASKVAWTFTASLFDVHVEGGVTERFYGDTVTAVVIDRERHETWHARLHHDPHWVGGWESWPANQQEGRLVTPIQEALR